MFACPRDRNRIRNAPGRYRPIDIDRTPLMMENRGVACECESRKWRGDRRSMKKVESRLSPFSILLLYFLTAGAVRK